MGHPETALRQDAGAVLLQIASTTAPSRNTAGTVSFEDVGFGALCRDSSQFHHTPARIVLWAILRSSLRQEHLLVDRYTHSTSPTTTDNRDGANPGSIDSGGSSDLSWKLGESALLVNEGVPKRLVEVRMAQEVSGHNTATKTSGQHSVQTSVTLMNGALKPTTAGGDGRKRCGIRRLRWANFSRSFGKRRKTPYTRQSCCA
ncbi:unnamed protein product [Ectocarpus sp. 12 AP-2014]